MDYMSPAQPIVASEPYTVYDIDHINSFPFSTAFALGGGLWYIGTEQGDMVPLPPLPGRDKLTVNYDEGADEYAAHRLLHQGVFDELCDRGLEVVSNAAAGTGPAILEVGCGTGNYVRAIVRRFPCVAYGLDPSAAMLTHARMATASVVWIQGRAEQMGIADATLDLIYSVDVIHHVSDRGAYYREVARTLKPGGQVCTVTDSAEIIRQREILSGYFPETVEVELARYPRVAQLQAAMTAAGLGVSEEVTVSEPYELTNVQPFRDKAYSSLHLIPERSWQTGLERMKRDLARGPIRGISRYTCLWGSKPHGAVA